MRARWLATSLLCALHAAGAQAPVAAAPEPGSELEVYVMTMGPGDAIWERFGHNGLGIRDRSTGLDVVYNWGVFRFTEADFLPRFLRGEMRYSVEPYDAANTLAYYQQTNRSVWVQELDLTPAQRLAVREFVEWNAQEANKYYRYDYFGDNCSTRVRDVIDRALGGALRTQFAATGSGRTFRDEARRLTDMDILYTGIDIGLGSPSDREMTGYEAMFIPMRFQETLREVSVRDPAGAMRPLVRAERQLFAATRPPDLAAPANHQLRFLAIGMAIALLIVGFASRVPQLSRVASITWCLVAGILGLLLTGLWGLTQHVWAYANVNLLFFHPLWLVLLAVVARRGRVVSWSRGLVAAAAGATLLGLVLGLLRTPQAAEQVALLAAPANLAVLWLAWRRGTA